MIQVITGLFNPQGGMSICINFHGDPATGGQDISLKTTKVIVVQDEK